MAERPRSPRPRIVVLGAGFGGLRAVKALQRAPADVLLVDRHNYHLFQPLLYQVATAGLEPEQIAKPVRAILHGQKNFDFRMADVTGVDFAARQLQTNDGAIPYDYLILSIGAETNFFGLGHLREHALALKDIPDAVNIRNHVLRCYERAVQEQNPERRRALLTFAVVGGGPTGVEMAGSLAELTRLVLVKDYPRLNTKDVRVLILEAADRLLLAMSPRLSEVAERTLWNKHVEVRHGSTVTDYDGHVIQLKSGEHIPAETMIWAAGACAAELAGGLGLQTGRLRRIVVEPTLDIPGHPEVFVIGDAAYAEADGQPLPMMAPVAIQMADTAARNIIHLIEGTPLDTFHYKDPGSLATIGRNAAVAQFGWGSFQGFPAWVVWLVVHLLQLIGFRNKLFVLVNWAWDYFFYDRAVRVITDKN